MAYPQYRGQKDKVHNTGVIMYGGDQTNMWPVEVATDTGRLITTKLAVASTTKALEAAAGYTAKDVLCETDTANSGTVWTFDAIARAAGKGGYITKAVILSETNNVTPRLTLLLFASSALNCELDDNAGSDAPQHADIANFIGAIDFPAMTDLGDDSYAIAAPSTSGNLPLAFCCNSGDDALYGVLVTLDDFTQTGGDDMSIYLTVEQE